MLFAPFVVSILTLVLLSIEIRFAAFSFTLATINISHRMVHRGVLVGKHSRGGLFDNDAVVDWGTCGCGQKDNCQ